MTDGTLTREELLREIESLHARIAELESRASGREQDRAARRESEGKFRLLVENIADAIFLIDLAGNVVDANQQAAQSLGYEREELLSLNVTDFIIGASSARAQERYEVLRAGRTLTGEGRHERKDGTTFPVETRMTLVRVDNQELILAAARDVTERKRAQAAERDQRVFAEALADTAAILNSTLDFDEVLDHILANVERVVPHAHADILLLEDGIAYTVRCRSASPALREKLVSLRLPVDTTPILRQMLETREPLVIPDTRTFGDWFDHEDMYWVRSYVGAPIRLEEKVYGFINLYNISPGFFNPTHARRLQAFSDQACIALLNAQLYDQAQELAAVEERQRLARELHDSVTQALSTANLIAQVLPHLWRRDPESAMKNLADLQRLTQAALAEMRALLLELRPGALREAKLGELLEQLADALAGRIPADVQIVVEEHRPLPADVQIALYRIAQEALNNVAKHAQARQVRVAVRNADGAVTLLIEDDGRGFDREAVPAGHFGLDIMRERAEAVGAALSVDSEVGKGARIEVTWSEES